MCLRSRDWSQKRCGVGQGWLGSDALKRAEAIEIQDTFPATLGKQNWERAHSSLALFPLPLHI